MKRISLVVTASLFVTSMGAAQTPSFGDVPWGSGHEAAKAALIAKGFPFAKADKDNDLWFSGTVLGIPTQIICIFSNDRLVKTMVNIATPNHQAIPKFREMREVLTRKYGTPKSMEHFTSPYVAGDGYEETAIRVGKGQFAAFWSEDGKSGLMVAITERLTVQVTYESPAWSAESDRRKAQATAAF